MNDAGEVLLTIYEQIRALALARRAELVVDDVFGLAVTEAVNCHKCGETTHQSCYVQYFYNTQVGGAGVGWGVGGAAAAFLGG
jgi:hypothetical protein